jgi:hypothetical protein
MLNHQYRPLYPQRSYHCHACAQGFARHQVDVTHEGKMAGLTAGLLAGAATKNPLVGIGIAVIGIIVGHWIDEEVTPKCPVCGEVLEILLEAALRS